MKYLLVLFFFVFSCTKTDNENHFSLNLEIEGLKKGIIYLEKISDSSMAVSYTHLTLPTSDLV